MICRAASLSDLAAFSPVMVRRTFARLAYQFGMSAAVTVEHDGSVLATGGLYRQEDHFELWFFAAGSLRNSRQAFRVMRILQAALASVPADQPVVAHVRDDRGAKLCRLFGMVPDGAGRFMRHSLAGVAGAVVSPPHKQTGVS